MEQYLNSTYCLDKHHPAIQQLVEQLVTPEQLPYQKVIALFYHVRDGWRYYPYNISFNKADLKASTILQRKEGHCIDKAILLITLCRACNIPARLGLASVRNHIATEKFEQLLGTNILVPHGYAEIYLDGKWLKLTPAFNKALCEKLQVAPLAFDGHSDALFQEYSQQGASFMEYLEEFGTFAAVPIEYMKALMQKYYPQLFNGGIDPGSILRT